MKNNYSFIFENQYRKPQESEKIYYVCVKSKLYSLSVKTLSDYLYVYLHNHKTNKLIYAKKINGDYLNYVQVSDDYKFISLPDNNSVIIYDLHNILINNIFDRLAVIKLELDKTSRCILSNEYYLIFDNVRDNIKDNIKDNIHKIMIIKFQDNSLNIYDNLNTKTIKTSEKYKYIIACDDNVIINNEKNLKGKIVFKESNTNYCISDTGIVYIIESDKIKIINTTEYIYTHNIKLPDNISCRVISCQDILRDIDMDDESDNIHALIITDNLNGNIIYWLITDNGVYNFYGPFRIVNDNILCHYHTNIISTLISENRVIISDLRLIIPIHYVEYLLNNCKRELLSKYSPKNLYNSSVKITSADDITYMYSISDNFVRYILDVSKDKEYETQTTTNIDIFPNVKSFQIYMEFLTGEINIDRIFNQKYTDKTNINNTMYDLMDHMYEYTKIMIIDKTKKIYVGYTLLLVLLRYCHRLYTMGMTPSKEIVSDYKEYYGVFADFIDIYVKRYI